jgi:hypothetical protein
LLGLYRTSFERTNQSSQAAIRRRLDRPDSTKDGKREGKQGRSGQEQPRGRRVSGQEAVRSAGHVVESPDRCEQPSSDQRRPEDRGTGDHQGACHHLTEDVEKQRSQIHVVIFDGRTYR